MTDHIRILICDDSIAVHESLKAYLLAENMECVSAYDGIQGLTLLRNESFDLVVLDVMMPGMFGTHLCREIRKTCNIPILMLSARGEEEDRILGLETGADDYVTKPFSPKEVVIRIKAILKRSRPAGSQNTPDLIIGELVISQARYEAAVNGKVMDLTPKEFELLTYMAKHKGRVMTRNQLMQALWGDDYLGNGRTVDSMIKRIRQKLPRSGIHFSIRAIYGVGYKFEVSP